MASLAEQLVRQLGVRPEHLRDLQLDPRKWAPIFRSGTGVQRTQGESRSSESSGTSGGGVSGGNAGAKAAPGMSMGDRDGSQASGSRQETQTSAKQAAARHGQTQCCAGILTARMHWLAHYQQRGGPLRLRLRRTLVSVPCMSAAHACDARWPVGRTPRAHCLFWHN